MSGDSDRDACGNRGDADDRAWRRLESERDILAMKLRAAERDVETYKAELAKLKRQLQDLEEDETANQKMIDDLKAKMQALQGQLDSSTSGTSKRGDGFEEKSGKRGSKSSAGYISPGGGVYTPGGTRIGMLGGESCGPGDVVEDSDAGPVQTEDKCIGGGPGPGLQETPVRCRGRAAGPLAMNKTGRVFIRTERSEPSLATLGPSKSREVAMFTANASRDLPVNAGIGEADSQVEPFLQHIWEQRMDALASCPRKQLLTMGACGATSLSTRRRARARGVSMPALPPLRAESR